MPIRTAKAFPLILSVSVACLAGCASHDIQRKDGRRFEHTIEIENLAKTDIDIVSEQTQREVLAGLKRLTVKLYLRNPREYRKGGYADVDSAVASIFGHVRPWHESSLANVDWAHSLRQAFNEHYGGDRVHAFMLALTVMVMASYDNRTHFYFTDELNAQSLYNSARNLETAAWKLSNARWPDGSLILISNSLDENQPNLSFEREFGKLIAEQDMMALIIEDKSNRIVNRVIQNVASFILLPV